MFEAAKSEFLLFLHALARLDPSQSMNKFISF